MVNARSKNKKSPKTCFSQSSIDHQSGAFIGSNDDLLIEILLRLPAESILRFKSVCKHWRSLLSHPNFTRRYDNNNLLNTPPGLFARNIYVPFDIENRKPPPFTSLDFCYDFYGIITVQSCNGLLLCCSNTPQHLRDYRNYYVFNPTTKQFAVIPSVIGGQRVRKTIRFMGLAFHQTDCVHYKVVCVRYLKLNEGLFQIQIYSSETREWKISIEAFTACGRVFNQGVYWNGVVYWAPVYGRYSCYKIDDEQLQMLSLPVEMTPFDTSTMYFGESGGHLHLIMPVNREESSFNVYEMLRDRSGWFVKYQVELDELLAAYPKIHDWYFGYDFKVVDVVRGETEENSFVVLNTEEKIITYNVHNKSFKQIFTLPKNFSGDFQYAAPVYEDFPRFHRYQTLISF